MNFSDFTISVLQIMPIVAYPDNDITLSKTSVYFFCETPEIQVVYNRVTCSWILNNHTVAGSGTTLELALEDLKNNHWAYLDIILV
jgi:hypothetical protein